MSATSAWSSTRASASAAWTASSRARPRTTSRPATAATGSRPRCAASSRSSRSRSARSAATTATTRRACRAARPARATSRNSARSCSSPRTSASAARRASRPARTTRASFIPTATSTSARSAIHRDEGRARSGVRVGVPDARMSFGDLDDPTSTVSELLRSRRYHTLRPEAGTRPAGLLPDVRGDAHARNSSTTRHNPLIDPAPRTSGAGRSPSTCSSAASSPE